MSLGDRTTSIQVMTPADNHQKCARAPEQFRLSGNLLRAIVAVWILLIGSETSWSQTGIMQFTAYPPDAVYEKFMGDHAWRIFATGEIDANAGKRLAALIKSKNIPLHSNLYLHSPGGNLAAGMALGRVIREYRLHTYIGRFDPNLKYVGGAPGFCYSACATAFLGGVFRYWTNGSVYGVHRFYWEGRSDKDADIAQILSATVVEYIRSMGVDTKIFALASQAGSSEIVTPSHETLLALNVVNDGRNPVKWTIESLSQGGAKAMYLKGEQETDNGMNKFMLVCVPGEPVLLYAIYDVGANADETMRFAVSLLFLDRKPIRVDYEKEIVNGMMNLTYTLNDTLLNSISKAKTVGAGLQPTPEGAIFSGFNSMPFEGGAAKLPGFLAVCHRN